MRFKVVSAACSHMGLLRDNNEDNFYLNGQYMFKEAMDTGGLFRASSKAKRQVYAVCDGMGGEEAGEEASYKAASMVERLHKCLADGGDLYKSIDTYTYYANKGVFELKKTGNTGTTLCLVCIHGDRATAAWLGDSRVYLMRGGTLKQITKDHTETQRLMDVGILTPEQAKKHPHRNALTRYLGVGINDMDIKPDYSDSIVIQKDDIFLLCSDGLTDMLSDPEISMILAGGQAPAYLSASLINAALNAGGRDNVTVIVLRAGVGRFFD